MSARLAAIPGDGRRCAPESRPRGPFHHACDIAHVWPRRVIGRAITPHLDPLADWWEWRIQRSYEYAYAWLAARIGFWPCFAGVGDSEETIRITGYGTQWMRGVRGSAGQVLASWPSLEGVVFSQYLFWHEILNATRWERGRPVGLDPVRAATERRVLAPARDAAGWMRYARRHPGQVQALAPALDFTSAGLSVRSRAHARVLIERGFAPEQIRVWRLGVA